MTDIQVDPIPADDRGDYNPGDCPACGQQLTVVTWLLHNPFEDTWLPANLSCVTEGCDLAGQPAEPDVPT